jgi:hypothetical protein
MNKQKLIDLVQVQWQRKGIDTPGGFLFSLTIASLITGNF